jgi:hypothetical protein
MAVSRTIPPGEWPVDPDLDVREGLEAGGKRFRSGRLEPELHPVDTNTAIYVPWSSVVCPTKGFYFIALREAGFGMMEENSWAQMCKELQYAAVTFCVIS